MIFLYFYNLNNFQDYIFKFNSNFILITKKTTYWLSFLERVVGIEPTFPAWKAGVLPIYDTRILERKTGLEPATSTLARWRSTIEPLSHIGADEGSRTPTPKALDPKSSASANFATSAFFWWLTGESNPGHLD